jgi:hypothetical protein
MSDEIAEVIKKEEPTGFRRLTSRKFLITIGTMIAVVTLDAMGIQLSDSAMGFAQWALGLFIGAEAAKDVVVAFNKSKRVTEVEPKK